MIMSLDPSEPPIDLTDGQTKYVILVELDAMIESTQEFIADDNITPWNDGEGRLMDLAALTHVRKLYNDFHPDEE